MHFVRQFSATPLTLSAFLGECACNAVALSLSPNTIPMA